MPRTKEPAKCKLKEYCSLFLLQQRQFPFQQLFQIPALPWTLPVSSSRFFLSPTFASALPSVLLLSVFAPISALFLSVFAPTSA